MPSALHPLVELKQVAKTYPSRRKGSTPVEALRPTTETFHRGEIVTIVGPSGCGKSTLLSLIAGLDTPTSGKLLIDGHQIVGPYTESGIVFQKDLLLPWRTALGNVLVQAEARGLNPKHYTDRSEEHTSELQSH